MPHNGWLRDASRETVGTGSGLAWELLESELTHLLVQHVHKAHPELQPAVAPAVAERALDAARASAGELLKRHEAQVESRRESIAKVAITLMQVRPPCPTAHSDSRV